MKKLLLALVAMITMSFAANAAAPHPTGNPSKDVKAVADYIIELIDNVNSLEEFDDLELKLNPLQEEFEGFYNENEELKEQFDKIGNEFFDGEEFGDRFEKAFKNAMRRIGLDEDMIENFMREEFTTGMFTDGDDGDEEENGEDIIIGEETEVDPSVTVDITPTGDPDVDAEVLAEYLISLIKNVKSVEDADLIEKKIEFLEEVFGNYYEQYPELSEKFDDAMDKYTSDKGYQKRLEDAMNNMYMLLIPNGLDE